MIGMGTIINTVVIIIGGICGKFFGKFLSERFRETLTASCGISVLFIGIGGALEKMFTVEGGIISSGRAMFIVICIALGALIGEIINIDGLFERFGKWLKIKTGSAKDKKFVEGFVNTSFTVCIGAMAIIGALDDGIMGDYTILATKSILDFVIVMIMTCSFGKGCVFSAIPVAILQGGVTFLATFIKPIMTETALTNLSLIGSILIFCVGLNLVWGQKVRVANLLPAIVLAVASAFLPFSF